MIIVPCFLLSWDAVGFRYSGNSTLQASWRNGTKKISFRPDFDEFEDDVPATQPESFRQFEQALELLIRHVYDRCDATVDYLPGLWPRIGIR